MSCVAQKKKDYSRFIEIAQTVVRGGPSNLTKFTCDDGTLVVGLDDKTWKGKNALVIYLIDVVCHKRRTGVLRRFLNQLSTLRSLGVDIVSIIAVSNPILDEYLSKRWVCPETGARFETHGSDFTLVLKA